MDDNIENHGPGNCGPPVVAPDGSVYLEVESSQQTDIWVCIDGNPTQAITYNESISLLHVLPGGGTQTQELNSYSTSGQPFPSNSPGDVIPDGQGSVLAAWSDNNGSTFVTDPGSAVTQPFPLGLNADNSLVLGDSKTAFGTDGTTVVSFNVSNLQQNWTYTAQGSDFLNFVAATSGGGVTINDSQLGVIQLDGSGNGATPVASLEGIAPGWHGDWYSISSGGLLQQVYSSPAATLPSAWTDSFGNPSLNRQSALGETLYLRSFAPWLWFGPEPYPPCAYDCFGGDDRSFSTATTGVTSRITGWVKLIVPEMIVVDSKAYSDPSHDVFGDTKTATPAITISRIAGTSLHIEIAGSNPLVAGAPDINTKLDISGQLDGNQACFSGHLFGDAFPNSEAFVVDLENQPTSLIRFATTANRNLGASLLLGDNNRDMGSFSHVCTGH